jgi:hypothetical protein
MGFIDRYRKVDIVEDPTASSLCDERVHSADVVEGELPARRDVLLIKRNGASVRDTATRGRRCCTVELGLSAAGHRRHRSACDNELRALLQRSELQSAAQKPEASTAKRRANMSLPSASQAMTRAARSPS